MFNIHNNYHWNILKVFQHFDLWSDIPSTFLQCFGFALLCVTHGHDFSKATYNPAVRNSFLFSTKISIWACWDVGVEIPSDFPTSDLNYCLGKVVQWSTNQFLWTILSFSLFLQIDLSCWTKTEIAMGNPVMDYCSIPSRGEW